MPDSKKILSVDDDPSYTSLYRQILESKGYTVFTANGLKQGYAAAKEHAPDIILLDVMMPEEGEFRDGFGLLEALRRDPAMRETPVLMISALGNEEDVAHGMALGATDYLPKQNMLPDVLLRFIAKLLEKK